MGKKRKAAAPKAKSRVVIDRVPIDLKNKELPRGLRRFGRQLIAFQKSLAASAQPAPEGKDSYQRRPHLEEATLGHRLHLANGRTPLFMLQGLARIERGVRKDREAFDTLRDHVKLLEDGLGEVDFWWAFMTRAEKWELPEPVQAWAETHHAHACGKVEGWLEANDWIPHAHLPPEGDVALRAHQLGALLADLEWPGRKKERKRLVAFLPERLRKMHAGALELDMNDLEGGLHELRRNVRWFSIYAAALEGALCLDARAAPPPKWDRYLLPEIVNSPFAALPAPDPETDPIVIPTPLFHALSWLIADLGAVKDRAQWSETIESGLRATKTPGTAAKWLGEQATTHREAGKHAEKVLQQTIVNDELLLRLAAVIEAQAGA